MSSIDKNITIAVIPFKTNTDEERVKNLFIGFVEDLITNFSKFIGLSVISSFSTNQITDISDQLQISKLLIDYLVLGNVRQLNNGIRVSIQLVKTEDNNLVFANQYNITLDTLLETQDSIVQQIVSVLQEKINHNILSHSYKKNEVELAAYENYLIGMSVLKKGTEDNDLKSRRYFEAALQIDPNYSLAYTGLSLSYFNFWSCMLWSRWDKSMEGAHKYALKAIELDPNDYMALGVLGRTYVYQEEFEKAEHCLRKSIRMNPNDASNLLRVSFSLLFLGYVDEAIRLYLKATEINPLHNDTYFAYGSNYYLEAGEFNKSIELSKKVLHNHWADFPAWIAAAYLQLNDFDNVWKYWNKYIEIFKKEAYTGNGELIAEAINWLSIINPFKGDNYLNSLCDFIRHQNHIPSLSEDKSPKSSSPSFFIQDGIWEIGYKNKTIMQKDAKGFHDIHKLLSQPQQEFHCLDLMNAGVDESNSIASIDSKANAQYLKRIKELQIEINDADELNQVEKIPMLREEYDAIIDHLSKSVGIGGKVRKMNSTVEKTRSAVTWRIRNTIKKIELIHPELSNHLSKSIKTGIYCSYKPEITIHWTL